MVFTESLKKNSDFKMVYQRGKSIANRNLVMYILKNSKNKNYLGISVSKKVGNSVCRSRVTRLIRESYRLSEKNIKSGFYIIVIARNSCKGISYKEMEGSLIHLLKKQGLYKNHDF